MAKHMKKDRATLTYGFGDVVGCKKPPRGIGDQQEEDGGQAGHKYPLQPSEGGVTEVPAADAPVDDEDEGHEEEGEQQGPDGDAHAGRPSGGPDGLLAEEGGEMFKLLL